MVISEEIILKARHFPVMGYKACKVVHGGKYVSPRLAEPLVVGMARGTDQPLHEALSDRELEVMSLRASGKTVSQIAELLSRTRYRPEDHTP